MKMPIVSLRRSAIAATLAALVFASFTPESAQAASGSWIAPGDGNWGVNANWNGATFPNGVGQSANFSGNTTGLLMTTTLDGNYIIGSSGKNANSSSNWTVTTSNNTLTLQASSGNSQIFNGHNGITLYLLDTDLILNSPTVLNGNGNNNARVTLGATVGGRTITGAGNITINNSNPNSGGVITINSNINTTGGIFNISTAGQNNHTIAGNIGTTVTGVTQNGNRTMILSGNNTYTTPTTVSLGVLQAGVASVAGVSGAFGNNSAVTIAEAAATLSLNNFNTQIGSLSGGGPTGGVVSLGNATLTMGGLNTDTLFAGNITGTGGGLTKIGNGTLTLTGVNAMTGPININAGTLVAGRAGNTDISTSSALNFNGGNLVIRPGAGFAKTYSRLVTANNAATLSYDNTNNTTYTLTFDAANALSLGADLTLKNVSSNATLVNAINITGAVSGSGNLTVETYNNIASSVDNYSLGRVLLSGNNTGWNGNLRIARGTVSFGGNTTVNPAGNGTIIIGTNGDAFGAGLTFFTSASQTYANNILVHPGGFRAIKGGSSDFNMTFNGSMTLNGNLTVDHFFPSTDRRINLNGPISGNGGLTATRTGGSAGTTLRMAGNNTYLGDTTVSTGASLALASTASLTSNVVVQAGARIGGPGTLGGNLTLADTANFFFYAVGLDGTTYVPMNVNGTVTLSNNFGVANLVGGSQGEVVPWATTTDGTYTLIGGATASNLSNIQNFGSANYATIVGSPTKYVYFQGATGLQLVVSSTVPSGGGDTTAPAAPTVALLAASDTGTLSNDLITNLTTPTIVVTLNGIGSGATAPLAGDVVKLFNGATQVATATLTAGDISAGSVNLTTSVLAPGSLSFTATVTDTAAVPNVSLASNTLVVTLDTTPPVIATPAPVSIDWGSSYSEVLPIATDAIPANPVVTPSGTVNAAKPGVYTLSYDAQDTAGNNAVQVQRTVTVAIANATAVGADGLTPLMRYALGANGPSDTVQAPVVSATSNTLVLTAVVRTDDPKLTVLGTTKTDLTSGTWTTTGVSGSPAGSGTVGDQTGVTSGQRRVYTVTTGPRTFLRLEATLAP